MKATIVKDGLSTDCSDIKRMKNVIVTLRDMYI